MGKIDEKYHRLLQHILNKGFKYEDPNRKGVHRIQIPSYTFNYNFKNGFPAITTKKLYWKGVVGELLWFLKGDTNIKYLVDNNINIWNKDAYNYHMKFFPKSMLSLNDYIDYTKREINLKNQNDFKKGDLGRIYGAQWRNWTNVEENVHTMKYYKSTIDQISNLIKGLKENPMGTRHIVTAWNPAELDDMALPPCHWSFEILVEPINYKRSSWLKVYSKKEYEVLKIKLPQYQFTLKWHQRSVDSFLGKM